MVVSSRCVVGVWWYLGTVVSMMGVEFFVELIVADLSLLCCCFVFLLFLLISGTTFFKSLSKEVIGSA